MTVGHRGQEKIGEYSSLYCSLWLNKIVRSWTVNSKPMKERNCSCLAQAKFVSGGGAKTAGLKRRLGGGLGEAYSPTARRRFKSRNARFAPRAGFVVRAGRRKACAESSHTRMGEGSSQISFRLRYLRMLRLNMRGPPKNAYSESVMRSPFTSLCSIREMVQIKSAT